MHPPSPSCAPCRVSLRPSPREGRLGLVLAAGLLAGCWATPTRAAEWQEGPGHRWKPLPAVPAHAPGFTRQPAGPAGILFTNHLADERSITNRNLLSGSGVACGDFDGDGRPDLFFCGLDSPSQLYRNLGNWRFTNVTTSVFAVPTPNGPFRASEDATGAAFADVDGDGDLDLLVNTLGGGTRLFRNDGPGRLTEATEAAGLQTRGAAMSLALADVDGDGDLDLYVCNFRATTILDAPSTRFSMQVVDGQQRVSAVNGRPVTEPDLANRFVLGPTGEVQELGEADVLWLNDGQGRFRAASWTDGTFVDAGGRALPDAPRDWGLAARFHDWTGDGRPDLYVCNDLWTPDRVWVNESAAGKVRFRALDTRALRNNPTFSMGVDFGDVNRDGHVDFFAVDMLSRFHTNRMTQLAAMAPEFRPPGLIDDRVQMKRNVLQINRGDGTFAETAWMAGVEASEWSWGPIFLDVDLDGHEDILVSNGQHRDFQDNDGAARIAAAQKGGRPLTPGQIQDLVRTFPRLLTSNVLFRNRGDATFEEVAGAWGFADPGISQGMALADLDGDGDLDVVINNLFESPGLYRNETSAPRIAVRLKGSAPNTAGIGAEIRVGPAGTNGPAPQARQVIAGGRYLSGDEPLRVFAAPGDAEMRVEVRWPGGKRSVIPAARPGRLYEVDFAGATAPSSPDAGMPAPFFVEVTDRLGHVHAEEPFDDLARQPLLPNRLSQLGPGVTWTDLDGDGHPDLVVGTGKGGPVGAYRGDGKGGFQRIDDAPFNKPAGRDTTTLVPLGPVLIAGSSNYEDGLTNGGALRVFDPVRKVSGEAVLGQGFSTGPVAAADVDGDGTLELFLGGRVLPGRYPEPAPALLLRTAGGRLSTLQRWEAFGLSSGACFTDLDGDGDPDLAVAMEWGPIRLLRNEGGQLAPWDPPVTREGRTAALSTLTGWWTAVQAGDFDGDGRLDLVAANWGWNTRYRSPAAGLRRIRAGDLTGSGTWDVIESWMDPATGKELPERDLMSLRMLAPVLAERFESFAQYAQASLGDLLGEAGKNLPVRTATELASMIFLNRGDHFEARPLPAAAQWAPAFGVCVGDYDGDGQEDVFLAQNWFSAQPLVQRNDAGRGLWLRGDGRGGFTADLLSGVAVYGEQRGAAVADFDEDGRVDLAVAQNAGPTTLWRNVRARPGLRVKLIGPPGNPSAFGAQVRVRHGDRRGPAREIHGGAGYWSVDSPVPVLGLAATATAVEVRWPDGKTTSHPVPEGSLEITARPDEGGAQPAPR